VPKWVETFFLLWCQCHTLKGYGTWPSTVAVTNFFLIVRTAELASEDFLGVDRTGGVICGQIAMLWS
jgi:hypothetical protein